MVVPGLLVLAPAARTAYGHGSNAPPEERLHFAHETFARRPSAAFSGYPYSDSIHWIARDDVLYFEHVFSFFPALSPVFTALLAADTGGDRLRLAEVHDGAVPSGKPELGHEVRDRGVADTGAEDVSPPRDPRSADGGAARANAGDLFAVVSRGDSVPPDGVRHTIGPIPALAAPESCLPQPPSHGQHLGAADQ